MQVWLRHGTKLFANGKGYYGYHQHDPPLTKDAKEDVEAKVVRLMEMSIPSVIRSSPFLRCRTTALYIQKELEKRGYAVPIEIDVKLGEFLGFQKPKGRLADVTRETRSYYRPILGTESLYDFNFRVNEYMYLHSRDENVWYVTHGLFISTVYKTLTGENIRLDALEGFISKDGGYERI